MEDKNTNPFFNIPASQEENGILSDHKREGKRFIPPLAQLGTTPISWVQTLLPELIWIGLLNHKFGLSIGAELSLGLSRAVAEIVPHAPDARWPIAISTFVQPETSHRERLLEELSKLGHLESLKTALLPLILFYPECPLKYLYSEPPAAKSQAELMTDFKTALAALFNRWEKPATLVQANAMYICFVSGKFKFFKGSLLEKFPEVAKFPDTEDSKMVASLVRASLNVQFGTPLYKPNDWPKYFWNRGLQLEPCDFGDAK